MCLQIDKIRLSPQNLTYPAVIQLFTIIFMFRLPSFLKDTKQKENKTADRYLETVIRSLPKISTPSGWRWRCCFYLKNSIKTYLQVKKHSTRKHKFAFAFHRRNFLFSEEKSLFFRKKDYLLDKNSLLWGELFYFFRLNLFLHQALILHNQHYHFLCLFSYNNSNMRFLYPTKFVIIKDIL